MRLLINGESFTATNKTSNYKHTGKNLPTLNRAIEQLNTIATNTITLYSSQQNFNGLDNHLAIMTGIVQSEMYNLNQNDDIINNSIGGTTEIYAIDLHNPNDGFAITFNRISDSDCSSFQARRWEEYTPDFVALQIKKGADFVTCDNCKNNDCSLTWIYQPNTTK